MAEEEQGDKATPDTAATASNLAVNTLIRIPIVPVLS
jgi:hypothetical protein